jgi:hypothetical protein
MGANALSFVSGSTLVDGGTADTLDQRNGVNGQTQRIFNTYTSATSYEDLEFGWTAGTAFMGTNKGSGGGSGRALQLRYGSTTSQALNIPASVNVPLDLSNAVNTGSANANGAVRIKSSSTMSATSGTHVDLMLPHVINPSATSTLVYYPLSIAPTINYANATPGAGSYEALHIAITETALPTGTNYMVRASGGAAGSTDVWSVTNTGNETVAGTFKSSRTTDLGWSIVNAANQACNTTCTSACVFGINTAAIGNLLPCTDATADSCLCAGAS